MSLSLQLAAYTEWRNQISALLVEFSSWLTHNELSDAQSELRLKQLLERLREDRLHVAFVAEFSRGKSELINAIFFADYGQRMLPSAPGRTTMCPTELFFAPGKPPCIELLPIQTRASHEGVSEYKGSPEQWQRQLLDIAAPDKIQEALQQVSATTRVTPAEAASLGFASTQGDVDLYRIGNDGLVEIPRWRHALINFPHPLLKQGLVILDTPGLNAIGTEPELTLSLLPNAHAILFVLSADTGVTQSDLAIWNEHIGNTAGNRRGRLVVLNKIDAQWDELKTQIAVDREIQQQQESCADILHLPAPQIFPISAKQGLIAKINGDSTLLEKSRLPALENALSAELIPAKQEIVRNNIASEFADIAQRTQQLLEARLSNLREQRNELSELRGKNKGVVEYMLGKALAEKEEFDRSLQRYQAVRSVFSTLSKQLFGHLGVGRLRQLTHATRAIMLDANFSRTLSEAMGNFFDHSKQALASSETGIKEIHTMMATVYKKFAIEHGLKLGTPTTFSLRRYEKELARLESWCNTHLNTLFKLLTTDKKNVTQKFFEEVAIQVRRAFEQANKDAEIWLRAIMAPLETQVREHHMQLKRRLESIKRIHQATDTLEDRIGELQSIEQLLLRQVKALQGLAGRLSNSLPLSVAEKLIFDKHRS